MGSITSWIRLEPRCRDDDLCEAVQARIYDPLWLLARQWQTGEFQGEDTGTPVIARWRAVSAPLTRYRAGVVAPNTQRNGAHYDVRALPLETLVERHPLAQSGEGSVRLAVESGLHFLRMLDAQPLSRSYRQAFLAQCVLQTLVDSEHAALDPETIAYCTLMAGRAPDARRLAAAARTDRAGLLARVDVAQADRAEVERTLDDWLAQRAAMFQQPQDDTADAWSAERLEYAFSVSGAPGGAETPLTAAQYAEGHLDWHSVDVDFEINLGAAQDQASKPLVRAVIPAPVSFRGAPAQRFWEMEDAAIDYGLLPAGPGDLPHLLLSEFATGFGNDWYVIPIELDVGTLTRTRSLVVTDSFGVQSLIAPVNQPGSAASGWSMFELSPIQREGGIARRPESNLFFLAPSLLRTIDSRPLEEVLFMRDEMANIAWAVEKVIEGPVEQRVMAGARADPPRAELEQPSAIPRYRLATQVPENWIPLLPQRVENSLRLVRAAMLHPDGSNAMREAQGQLLNARARLALFDEEIPRAGVRVTRQFERTRWIDGRTLLWVGLRKQVGRGEGSSALRFDAAGED